MCYVSIILWAAGLAYFHKFGGGGGITQQFFFYFFKFIYIVCACAWRCKREEEYKSSLSLVCRFLLNPIPQSTLHPLTRIPWPRISFLKIPIPIPLLPFPPQITYQIKQGLSLKPPFIPLPLLKTKNKKTKKRLYLISFIVLFIIYVLFSSRLVAYLISSQLSSCGIEYE